MAPLSAAVGATKSETILLENPLSTPVVFKVENDNPTNFRVVTAGSSPIITIPPNGQFLTEVRFIPTTVSVKTNATINFSSRIVGDYTYRFSGYGKTPSPASPTVVKTMVQVAASGQIKFFNTFPFAVKFEVILQTESSFFSILSKRRVFTLSEYQEEYQIESSARINNINSVSNINNGITNINNNSISPMVPSEHRATVLVATVGIEPAIHWTFPIVGNIVQTLEKRTVVLKGKANVTAFHKITINLTDEKFSYDDVASNISEAFCAISTFSNISVITAAASPHRSHSKFRTRNSCDYVISLHFPSELIWMKKYFTILPFEIVDKNYVPFSESDQLRPSNESSTTNRVCVVLKTHLRRPIEATSLSVIVEKPSTNQKWKRDFDIQIDQDLTVNRIISLESPVNLPSSTKIKIREQIRVRTDFSAFFTPNSSHDLSVSPAKATIEPTMLDEIELPFVITYFPKTYGKMMKGLLIVESEELHLVFEVHGRMPRYVPPKTRKSGKIDTSTQEGAKQVRKSSRNFIKENIECICVYQKSGQLKLKLNNSYNNDAGSINDNAGAVSKANPRNRTKVRNFHKIIFKVFFFFYLHSFFICM